MSTYRDNLMMWCTIFSVIATITCFISVVTAIAMERNGVATPATTDVVMAFGVYLLCYGALPATVISATLLVWQVAEDTRRYKRIALRLGRVKERTMEKPFEFYSNFMSCGRHAKQVLDRYRNQASQELQPKTFSRHPNSKKKRSK